MKRKRKKSRRANAIATERNATGSRGERGWWEWMDEWAKE